MILEELPSQVRDEDQDEKDDCSIDLEDLRLSSRKIRLTQNDMNPND